LLSDIYSRKSVTVGSRRSQPVQPKRFGALECRRTPSYFGGRRKHSKATSFEKRS